MNQLVTFFSQSDDPKDKTRLVGIGLTDKMIEHIKEKGMVLEPTQRTKMDTDVVIVYGADMGILSSKLARLFPKDKTEIHVL